MGIGTGISWTDNTVNFWTGCTKISPACANCYMYRDSKRYGKDPTKIVLTKKAWKDIRNPYMKGKCFVCSWSDFLHPDADQWRSKAYAAMRLRPDLIFQILTKRIERWEECKPYEWDWNESYKNLWLGVTVESMDYIHRIAHLILIDAAVRFISVEPMLEAITIPQKVLSKIDWVIIGCESGPDRRETKDEWVFNLLRECRAAKVPVFIKQLSSMGHIITNPHFRGKQWLQFPKVGEE